MGQPIRKRLKRFEIAQQPRFLTFSCYQRLPLFQNDLIKDRFLEHLAVKREQHRFLLHGWVVMPEHVHLLLTPALPDSTVSGILRDLKGKFSIEILERWKSLNAPILHRLRGADTCLHFWQAGGGYDRNVRHEDDLNEKLNYIHENPKKRGLVAEAIDWRWSSAQAYAGQTTDGLQPDSWT